MQELQEGTKIVAPNEFGSLEHGIIMEHTPSPASDNVYLVRWLSDGTQTLFEVTEKNLIREKKNAGKKRHNRKKNKRHNRPHRG